MMLSLIISALVATVISLLFRAFNTPWKPPILGVYQQKNKYYWLKYTLIYCYALEKQIYNLWKRAHEAEIGKVNDRSIQVYKDDAELEKFYDLGDFPNSIDSVYYSGVNSQGDTFVCGFAQRANLMCDTFTCIKIKDDVFLSPDMPDTTIRQNQYEPGYMNQGLEIHNIIPMRSWTVTYVGEMKSKSQNKLVKVEAILNWNTLRAPFNFNLHMSPSSLARDFAREPWSKDYFKLLEKYHLTQYQQMGQLTGVIIVDGQRTKVAMPCVRDHTFGKNRKWRNFHRYVLHYIFLSNGDCIMVGVVSRPIVLSHFTIGYICKEHEQPVAVDRTDFKLYQHGEHGLMPRDYSFSFYAGEEKYVVQILVQDEEWFYVGDSKQAIFFERWANVDVNGVKGKACCEWQYNNVHSKFRFGYSAPTI